VAFPHSRGKPTLGFEPGIEQFALAGENNPASRSFVRDVTQLEGRPSHVDIGLNMASTRPDGRQVLASFKSWEDFGRSLVHTEVHPATRDDVPRVKLDGPPATAAQIDEAFRAGEELRASEAAEHDA
jgi:hypothetical protein